MSEAMRGALIILALIVLTFSLFVFGEAAWWGSHSQNDRATFLEIAKAGALWAIAAAALALTLTPPPA